MPTTPDGRHRGRPRSRRSQDAILGATLESLAEVGYQRLTIQGVARRAGVSKATIYRWWSTKAALVLEAAADHLAIGIVPDSGSTRSDLQTAAEQLITTFSDRIAGIVILAAIARVDDDPEMAAQFRRQYVLPWRASATAALQRGVARGDVRPGLDVDLALDVLVGTVLQRTLVVPEPNTRGLSTSLADILASSGDTSPPLDEGSAPR
jgi:AcrR family transcriptional regulator